MKTFVTGIYGCGKTTFAKNLARKKGVKYISFDGTHDYSRKENQAPGILASLPESFVIDAIPMNNGKWDDFIEYESKLTDITVICVYCPDRDKWLGRLGTRAVYDFPGIKNKIKKYIKKAIGKKITPKNEASLLKNYRDFFLDYLPFLKNFKRVFYYDSIKNEFTSLDEMLGRINFKIFRLEDRLDSLPEGYDKNYQDIEILNFKGYSESYKTWGIIKNMFTWKGKRVVDLGCFHGYFSFKAEDEDAKVIGLDRAERVLETSRMINDIRGGNVEFMQWTDGEEIPECDIILCLNVFHHFDQPALTLEKMKCGEAIFEINRDNLKIIEKRFKRIKTYSSMRKNRIILHCVN